MDLFEFIGTNKIIQNELFIQRTSNFVFSILIIYFLYKFLKKKYNLKVYFWKPNSNEINNKTTQFQLYFEWEIKKKIN